MDNAILIKNGIILFYGNNAGYIDENQAIVDTMFESKELSEFLIKKVMKFVCLQGYLIG